MPLDRRHFLRAGLAVAASACLAPKAFVAAEPVRASADPAPPSTLRIALLHLAPVPGDVPHNRRLIETAVAAAAELGAQWIVTPELCVTGYTFADRLGVTWILPQPDEWMTQMGRLVARLGVTLFLSHPERDRESGNLHNSLFVLAPDGAIAGTHRKINSLRVGSEGWSSPGTQPAVVSAAPVGRVGLLICADAYSPEICLALKARGARLLISSAAWAPGLHGPSGEWERCTRDTGLPLIVCNRTGPDRTLDFTEAESVVVKDGRRVLSLSSTRSAIFVLDWDVQAETVATPEYRTVAL